MKPRPLGPTCLTASTNKIKFDHDERPFRGDTSGRLSRFC